MDLSTTYMGLQLANPLVVSACPLTRSIDRIRQMEDAGAGAIVLYSLFEEQVSGEEKELEFFLSYASERFAESLTYYPEVSEFHLGPDEYLEHIAHARQAVDVPIIASLNGVSATGWSSFARQIEQAGAHALELNTYFLPADPKITSEMVERVHLSACEMVRKSVSIPLAVKLSPYFSSPASMAARFDQAGADALVLFNRFYQPDIDLETLELQSTLKLSEPIENRLALRWIAILCEKVECSLAACTGIHDGYDVAKMILAGADVAMMCSTLLKHGISHLGRIRAELVEYMQHKGYETLAQMRGAMSYRHCPNPIALERTNYMKMIRDFVPSGTLE